MHRFPSLHKVVFQTSGLSLCALALLAGPVSAQVQSTNEPSFFNPFASRDPLTESGRESDHLLGDFGGWRTRLVERGWHFQLGYIAESMANVSGGMRRGGNFQGLAKLALDLDLEKASGFWKGGELFVSALWLHGDSLTGKRVGDVTTLSNMDAYDGVRLYELWLQQNFFGEKMSLRAGNLLADEEFAFTEYGGLFLNSAFGWPHFISANTVNTGPAFFVTGLGARLRVDPCDYFYAQAGVYDGDTFDDPFTGDPHRNSSGTRFHLSGEQGLFSLYEVGLKLNQGENATGLPGNYKVGAWWHTGSAAAAFQDQHGIYFAGEQLVWREEAGSDQGLGLFARIGGSPSNQSAFNLAFDGGIHYQGLLPARDADVAGIGVDYARMSDSVRATALVGGITPPPDYEMVIEANYQVQLKPWWTIQPNVQWVLHPGGSKAISDAVIVGFRTNLTF